MESLSRRTVENQGLSRAIVEYSISALFSCPDPKILSPTIVWQNSPILIKVLSFQSHVPRCFWISPGPIVVRYTLIFLPIIFVGRPVHPVQKSGKDKIGECPKRPL